jgi:hypothetical protein
MLELWTHMWFLRSAARAYAVSLATIGVAAGRPLLWVADALAWSHSAGGAGPDRIAATPLRM